jgi:hypothetical protein
MCLISEIHQIIEKKKHVTSQKRCVSTHNQSGNTLQARNGEPFGRRLPKLSTYFEEILSQAHEHFEEQIKIFESFTIIINCRVIIINAYYNYIITAN